METENFLPHKIVYLKSIKMKVIGIVSIFSMLCTLFYLQHFSHWYKTVSSFGMQVKYRVKWQSSTNHSSIKPVTKTNNASHMEQVIIETVDNVGELTMEKLHILTEPASDSPFCTEEIFLTVIVISAVTNFLQRNAIRGTWGNTDYLVPSSMNLKPKIVFVVGESKDKKVQGKLASETRACQDVVIANFIDSYKIITLKAILGLKWAKRFCLGTYVLKTDDDTFINLRKFMDWLSRRPRNIFYAGKCVNSPHVRRDPNDKWFVSRKIYPDKRYPPYCFGLGYILSKDVLDAIYRFFDSNIVLPIEDAYIGILIKKYYPRATTQSIGLFCYPFPGFDKENLCNYLKFHLFNPVQPHGQLKLLKKIELAKQFCVS